MKCLYVSRRFLIKTKKSNASYSNVERSKSLNVIASGSGHCLKIKLERTGEINPSSTWLTKTKMKVTALHGEKSSSPPLLYPEVFRGIAEDEKNKFPIRRGIKSFYQRIKPYARNTILKKQTSVTSNSEATVPNLKDTRGFSLDPSQEDILSNIFMYSPSHAKENNLKFSCETGPQTLNDTNLLTIDEQLNTPIIDINRDSQFFKTTRVENQSIFFHNINDQLDQISYNNSYDQLTKIQKNKLTNNQSKTSNFSNKIEYSNQMDNSYDSEMYFSPNSDSEDLIIFDSDENMNMIFTDNFSNIDEINNLLKDESKDNFSGSDDSNVLVINSQISNILYKDIMITDSKIPKPLMEEEINFEFNETNIFGHTINDNCIKIDELHCENNSFDSNIDKLIITNENNDNTLSFMGGENDLSIKQKLPIDSTLNKLQGFINILDNNIDISNNMVQESNFNTYIDNNPQNNKLKYPMLNKLIIPEVQYFENHEDDKAAVISTPDITNDILDLQNEKNDFDLISFITSSATDRKEDLPVEIKVEEPICETYQIENYVTKNIRLSYECSESLLSTTSDEHESVTKTTPKRRGRPPKTDDTLPSPTFYQHLSEQDAKYVEMRNKNNLASRRSRMNRKHRELSIEDEAKILETKYNALEKEEKKLEKLIKKWEKKVMNLASYN